MNLRPRSIAERLARFVGLVGRTPIPVPLIEPELGSRRRRGPPAQGVRATGTAKTRTIVVRVDDVMFEEINRVAVASDTHTTEAIRQLIRRGLDGGSE